MKEGDRIAVMSATSGRKLYGFVRRVSRVRRFFLLPYVRASVLGSNFSGPKVRENWYRRSELTVEAWL